MHENNDRPHYFTGDNIGFVIILIAGCIGTGLWLIHGWEVLVGGDAHGKSAIYLALMALPYLLISFFLCLGLVCGLCWLLRDEDDQ